jgi:6-phospho-3-hexuloisomerase
MIRQGIKKGARVSVRENLALVAEEVTDVLRRVDEDSVTKLVDGIVRAEKIFLFGQGRTGYVTRAFAVRLMHLGLNVHFVGDTTAPSIAPKDLCLVNSGTGETRFSFHAMEAAREAGATTATMTAHPQARISKMADIVVIIPAPTKGETFGPRKSRQPAGSLFEQALFVLLEAVVLVLMDRLGPASREDMLKRHTNIE